MRLLSSSRPLPPRRGFPPIAERGEREKRKGRLITAIMTGFFEELSEVIMQVIIRPASIDPPSLAHRLRGWRLRGSRTRTLRRHPLRRTPSLIWRACARARSARVPAIVRDQKTKAAKTKRQVRVFSGAGDRKQPDRKLRGVYSDALRGDSLSGKFIALEAGQSLFCD